MSSGNFSLAKSRIGIYFADGRGISWYQINKDGTAPDEVKAAIRAAKRVFFRKLNAYYDAEKTREAGGYHERTRMD